MVNYNKTYHKGEYRSGEWAKHLRPYLKRVGNKRWRKAGRSLMLDEEELTFRKRNKGPKPIVVRITKMYYGNIKCKTISKYRSLRDARNAMRQGHIVRAEIISL